MIDRETVDKILDAANIVEVVSDFVHLRRRGANYIGLCPFHNEKTPSFSVSPAKGICHCFSCGKGGSAVNFIMEHEQMSYYEALKYLARKYNIEVKERELSDEEKKAQSERESLFIVNEFAAKQFEHNLMETDEGRNIGLSYFYERGFTDAIIKKFHLGYSMEARTSLYDTIRRNGYNPKYAVESGLCIEGDHGTYDRFRGRVMFPVLNIAGKVVAFGGRTLKHDHAKYVNSPESSIYKKSYELYGLYQAKQAIVKKEKCYLVEGYTDVLSMHQSGVENVVASSGTSLTEGQIRLIHRFTENVTVLYDGDAAGIKASLRGIDLLLAEGLNIKVLLLPDNDDPDSFAKKHSATEFQDYISTHEQDFIRFKTEILLSGSENDPIRRAEAISDIVKSISVIPSEIKRAVYTKECSDRFGIEEKILSGQVAEKARTQSGNRYAANQRGQKSGLSDASSATAETNRSSRMSVGRRSTGPAERLVVQYIVRYGMCCLGEARDEQGNAVPVLVLEYIRMEMEQDDMEFSVPAYRKTYEEALRLLPKFYEDYAVKQAEIEAKQRQAEKEGVDKIRAEADDLTDITRQEQKLAEDVAAEARQEQLDFRAAYLERHLCSDPDDDIRRTATELASERYRLSRIYQRYGHVETEADKIGDLVPRAIFDWKDAIVGCRIQEEQRNLSDAMARSDDQAVLEAMERMQNLQQLRSRLAKVMGERSIVP